MYSTSYARTSSDSSVAQAELSPERFYAIVDMVRRRKHDPEAQHAIETDPDVAEAWSSYQDALGLVVREMATSLRYINPKDIGRKPFARALRSGRYVGFRGRSEKLFTPELAVVLGELSRVSRLSPEEVRREEIAPEPLEETQAEKLGDAQHLKTLYPLLSVASDALYRHKRKPLEEGEEGLTLPFVFELAKDLDQLQDLLAHKDSAIVRRNITRSTVANLMEELASRNMLRAELFEDAFQRCHDESWHTMPRTRSARGALVHTIRERAKTEGSPKFLIKLAASSDGRNRAVAAISSNTDVDVYDKLIRDNSLHTLLHVVESDHFDNNRAFAMIDQYDLPLQQVAVMLNSHARKPNGEIDIGIRALACERAIANERVDPLYIYEFLRKHHTHEEVPPYLWPEFVKEVNRRLAVVRAHGDEKQIEKLERRVERFTEAFTKDILQPYWEAARRVIEAEKRGEEPPAYSWRGRELARHRKFVEAHEFVRDEELLRILVEGTEGSEDLASLLRYCVEAGLPVTRELLVKVFTHEDREVRTLGMQLLPNTSEEDVKRAEEELKARVAADHEKVRDRVFALVIPDYEPIDAEPRLLSRMRHYFASDDLTEAETREIFFRFAELDPRKIPTALEEAARAKRLRQRVDGAAEVMSLEPSQRHDFARPATQGDMFEDIPVPPARSSNINETPQTRSR